jgi:deoxyribose-phosphate aldolase
LVFVVSVVDFPLGRGTIGDACFQCAGAVKSGAGEVDMVVDVGAIKSGKPAAAMEKIRAVTAAAAGAPVKVILETGLLSEPQIVEACAAAAAAGAAYVKTSTGFGPRGASLRDVEIMRAAVGETMGIKAAGGIRDRETCLKMVAAGADRIGTSAGPACVLELPKS